MAVNKDILMSRLFILRRSGISKLSAVKNDSNLVEGVENLFKYLRIYYWIHGLGLLAMSISETTSKKFCAFCLEIFVDMNEVLLAIILYSHYDTLKESKYLINTLVYFAGSIILFIQKLVFYYKRKTLITIIENLANLHSRVDMKLTIRCKLLLFLAIFDAFLAPCAYLFSIVATTQNLIRIKSIYLEVFSKWSYLIAATSTWSSSIFGINLYFCLVCSILTQILRGLEDKLDIVSHRNGMLVQTYNDTVNVIKVVAKNFRGMLFISTLIALVGLFFQVFDVVFSNMSNLQVEIFRVLNVFVHLSGFVPLCLSASAVQNADDDVRDKIEMLSEADDEKCISLKLCPKFKGFTILDSIMIDKSLILSAIGVLFTYGIMIATYYNSQ